MDNGEQLGVDTPGEEDMRARLASAKRVVVKIGSSSLTGGPDFSINPRNIDRIVDAVHARIARGSDVIIVSSGSIAAGLAPLGLNARPADLATKQAAASVGQVHLAQEWGRSFARYDTTVGQVLLTASDTGQRDRARNAQRTLNRLQQLGVVPIVNENDTVATTEMRFGDNDRLAALVAHLISADALVLLSDVDGLYDRNPADPGARFIPEIRDDHDLDGVVAGDSGVVGTGGMASKVSAARLAACGGVPVLLASAAGRRLSAWKFWALYAAEVAGTLRIDAGAVTAVTSGGRSLLPIGIQSCEGEFHPGDIVEIMGPDGQIIGRGETNYSHGDLANMLGRRTGDLPADKRRPVVHADYLSNM